jgi:hypothetical protein
MFWHLENARLRFREAVERAYRRLFAGRRDFKRFLLEGPDFEGLELERSADTGRAIEL